MGTKAVYFLTATGEGGLAGLKEEKIWRQKKSRAVARKTFYPRAT
jgi:hypothetical protein